MSEWQEHKVIYLEPWCSNCDRCAEDRSWCQDNVWDECEECGRKPSKFKLCKEQQT